MITPERKMVTCLDSRGLYGNRFISIYDLKSEFDELSQEEFEECIITIFRKEVVIVRIEFGIMRISLVPSKKAVIDRIIRG